MHPCFFFLMHLRPPISPLFPYTTLFRSQSPGELVEILHLEPDVVERTALRCVAPHVTVREGHVEAVEVNAIGKDRKSTRLNSSHANISYAVFCLKKKNT